MVLLSSSALGTFVEHSCPATNLNWRGLVLLLIVKSAGNDFGVECIFVYFYIYTLCSVSSIHLTSVVVVFLKRNWCKACAEVSGFLFTD